MNGEMQLTILKLKQTTAALKALLDHYVDLVASGDAGKWDPEEEEVVLQARRVLSGPYPD